MKFKMGWLYHKVFWLCEDEFTQKIEKKKKKKKEKKKDLDRRRGRKTILKGGQESTFPELGQLKRGQGG